MHIILALGKKGLCIVQVNPLLAEDIPPIGPIEGLAEMIKPHIPPSLLPDKYRFLARVTSPDGALYPSEAGLCRIFKCFGELELALAGVLSVLHEFGFRLGAGGPGLLTGKNAVLYPRLAFCAEYPVQGILRDVVNYRRLVALHEDMKVFRFELNTVIEVLIDCHLHAVVCLGDAGLSAVLHEFLKDVLLVRGVKRILV